MEKQITWRDDEALRRFQIISPLLDETLDKDAKLQKRKEISERENISTRTIYRYEKGYRDNGFEGLKPAERSNTNLSFPENFSEIMQQAIQLKREVPKRSVKTIIDILELEGWAAPGVLKRSTLERHLYNAGFGIRQMQIVNDARTSSSKRFCKPHRMMLIQADIKEGPKLPIGKNGKKVKTYLSSVIDDHSRMILYSKFYDNEKKDIVEESFRQALALHGRFDCAYCDHGSQYISTQLKRSMALLGIPIRYAPIKSGKSKGIVEKFHQVVDRFTMEYRLKKSKADQTLEKLNYYWSIYLEDYYQKDSHDGIREYYASLNVILPPEGISPVQEFNRDTRPLTFIDTAVLAEAFRHHETRRVDKGACISFQGRKYETKAELIGCMVDISYDPHAPETVTVHYKDIEPFDIHPLKIGAFCDKTPTLPASMQIAEAKTSRLLDALEKQHKELTEHRADALSFAQYGKEGE